MLRLGKVDPYKPVDIFIDEYLTVSTTEMGGWGDKDFDLRCFYGFRIFVILTFNLSKERKQCLLDIDCSLNVCHRYSVQLIILLCEVVEYIRVFGIRTSCLQNNILQLLSKISYSTKIVAKLAGSVITLIL